MGRDRGAGTDEPLDGDIGPAAGRAPGPEQADVRAELRRYEAERAERRRRTNAVAGRVTGVLVALFLLFLIYDSVGTAIEAHARGDDWIHPPAVVAAVCAAALTGLLTWAWRRRRLGM